MGSNMATTTRERTRIVCARCGKHIAIRADMTGGTGRCPSCGSAIDIAEALARARRAESDHGDEDGMGTAGEWDAVAGQTVDEGGGATSEARARHQTPDPPPPQSPPPDRAPVCKVCGEGKMRPGRVLKASGIRTLAYVGYIGGAFVAMLCLVLLFMVGIEAPEALTYALIPMAPVLIGALVVGAIGEHVVAGRSVLACDRCGASVDAA